MGRKQLSMKNLKSGLVIANDIYSEREQLILPRNTVVDDAIKERLISYNIPYVWVYDSDNNISEIKEQLSNPTFSERLQRSGDFKKFQKHYDSKTLELKTILSNALSSDEHIDTTELLKFLCLSLIFQRAEQIYLICLATSFRRYDLSA
jgi:hypothetical protein